MKNLMPSRLVRLLASVWLGVGLTLHSKAEASYHANNNMNNRHRRYDRGTPQRPTSRFGFSPPSFDMHDDEDAYEPSSSYFERYGISPPPLISRNKIRRRVQANEGARIIGGVSARSEENDETMSELEAIVYNAKRGENANSRLRYDLLWQHDGDFDKYFYDKHSYPWEYIWYNQTEGKLKGLPVEMNINFHRVFSVDIVNSMMDLVVWFRLVWVDPRLTWKPEEYGGLTQTWFWIGDGGAGGETSEIWTPDIELWNLETGIKGSLEDTYARVSYDGTVWWGRPGHLKPTCKFSGLGSFPFDILTCTMEFGSWMLNGKYLRMEKFNGVGFTKGGSLTAGESYAEYTFTEEDSISCEKHIYQSAGQYHDGEEDWPVLFYNVTVRRAWEPYARGYIAVQVVLNFVGFSAFWLPPSCGERMSLSVTAMLAALASEIVIAANLPRASKTTWFSKFSMLSLVFAFVALSESVLVLYFYYKRCEDCVPEWYSFAKNWYLVKQAKKGGEEVRKRSNEIVAITTGFVTETTNTAVDAVQDTTDTLIGALTNSKDALTTCVKEAGRVKHAELEAPSNDSEESSPGDGLLKDDDIRAEIISLVEATNPGKSADELLAVYVGREEELVNCLKNMKADQDRDGRDKTLDDSIQANQDQHGNDNTVDDESVKAKQDRDDKNRTLDDASVSRTAKASNFSRVTFSTVGDDNATQSVRSRLRRRSVMMKEFQNEYGSSMVTGFPAGARNADDFLDEQEMENNFKWKHFASRIDDVARFWIPLAYIIALAIVFDEVF